MNSLPSAANSHFRHPSFDNAPPAKRKQPMPIDPNIDMEEDDESELRPTKRRRCVDLESGIAHLSLNQSATLPNDGNARLAPTSASARPVIGELRDGPWPSSSQTSMPFLGSDRQGIVFPGSVEEPSVVPEVQMGASSRDETKSRTVVITDLDSYSEDEGDGLTVEDVTAPPGLDVNPVLLEHLRSNRIPTLNRSLHPIPPSDDSRALVLYQPLLPLVRSGASPPDSDVPPEPQPLLESEDAMDLDV